MSDWISVKVRKPEVHKLVLCVGSKGGMFLGMSNYSGNSVVDGALCMMVPNARGIRYATHWMSLPEPPKEANR